MAQTDEVANAVAGNMKQLLDHGIVRVRGYALVTKILVEDLDAATTSNEREVLRVYINPTFDRWIDLPKNRVRHQVQENVQTTASGTVTHGPSSVWVDADAVVIYGYSGLAANIAQSVEDGGYPDWPP